MSVSYSYGVNNAQVNAIAALLNGGYLRIYDGIRRAVPDDPITTQVLLSEQRFSDPAFGAAVNGVITAEPIDDVLAVATGTPSWFATVAADGTTAIMDGSVGATGSGADLEIANLVQGQILENRTMSISGLVYTEPR